jgi:KipI family sensor histidine kinase inhibitor
VFPLYPLSHSLYELRPPAGLLDRCFHYLSAYSFSAPCRIFQNLNTLAVETENPAQVLEALALFDAQFIAMPDVHPIVQVHQIPVCYDPVLGNDLHVLSAQTGLTPEEIIQIHCAAAYKVGMMGFLPGFGYLTGLDPRLRTRRKAQPDARVRAGSVAIAEDMTGIYPFDSPGGWLLLGHTPQRMVDFSNSHKPTLLQCGDRVTFYPISIEAYGEIAH